MLSCFLDTVRIFFVSCILIFVMCIKMTPLPASNPALLAQMMEDLNDPEIMAEAQKMMSSPEFKSQMKQMENSKVFKEALKTTKEKMDDPNLAGTFSYVLFLAHTEHCNFCRYMYVCMPSRNRQ